MGENGDPGFIERLNLLEAAAESGEQLTDVGIASSVSPASLSSGL